MSQMICLFFNIEFIREDAPPMARMLRSGSYQPEPLHVRQLSERQTGEGSDEVIFVDPVALEPTGHTLLLLTLSDNFNIYFRWSIWQFCMPGGQTGT